MPDSEEQQIQAFAELVREYCSWAESPPGEPTEEVHTARRLLALLYANALLLPAREGDENSRSISHEEWKEILGRFACISVGFYWVAHDPIIKTADEVNDCDTAITCVADDLADAWRDLKAALELYDTGYIDAAVWDWRFNFFHHWGQHASRALMILHLWVEENVGFFDG